MSDFDELMEFRVMIEAELARLAAALATEENIQIMQTSLNKMRKSGDNLMDLTLPVMNLSWPSVAIGLVDLVLLMRYKRSVPQVIIISAGLGILLFGILGLA